MLWDMNSLRANKQILELCQCLAACGLTLHKMDGSVYRITHENHPVVKWMQESDSNLAWCIDFLSALVLEFKLRSSSGKMHGCTRAALEAAQQFGRGSREPVRHKYFSDLVFPEATSVYDSYEKLLNFKIGMDALRKNKDKV